MTDYNTVYIVGAGPGDPELLTIKGLKLLQEYAEVVVYDRLISPELLAFIPDHVEKTYAGKSCKKHEMTQDAINNELVERAKAGKKVVRLKGGDPFIFGRGGEEVLYLAQHNIPFEIVPGINAASGIASKLGLPLTHRGVATSVQYITGHQQKGEAVSHDWKALAKPDNTLVVYMGLANIEKIAGNLIEAGLLAETPVLAVQEGTMKGEKRHYSTLRAVAADLNVHGFEPPTVIYIGKVVDIARQLKLGE